MAEINKLEKISISTARLARMLNLLDLIILFYLWIYVRIMRFSDDDILERMIND